MRSLGGIGIALTASAVVKLHGTIYHLFEAKLQLITSNRNLYWVLLSFVDASSWCSVTLNELTSIHCGFVRCKTRCFHHDLLPHQTSFF